MIFNSSKFQKISLEVRQRIIQMSHESKVGHLGSALSIVDILVMLYFSQMRVFSKKPHNPKRDRFILSKGHSASALYAILAKKGFFPKKWLDQYCKNGGRLGTHPDHFHVPGVEWTTGSLGHGLSVGSGIALAGKLNKAVWKTYVLISDAESQEGEVWEAALTAAHHKLSNLIVIIDYNHVQAFGKVKEVLQLEPFADKWLAFGWNVITVDGHNHLSLFKVLKKAYNYRNKPTVIIATTVRGKGVSFMENKIQWYYNYPKDTDYQKALKHLK